MIICLCTLLTLLLCAPCPSLRAEDDPQSYQMEDVVVTAPAGGKDTLDLPSSTTIITRTQIEQLPAQEIDDVLKHAAGVQLWQPWGIFGPDSRPTLRGFSQSRATLFMKDGMPMNRVICGGAKTNEFPLEMVEEIMIGRGMNASVMGTSAMAGIINIEGKTPGEKSEAQVKATYGTYGTWGIDGGVSARISPKWGFLAGYHHFDTDGYQSWSDDWVASKIEEWSQLDAKGENTVANFREAIDDKQTRTTNAASGRLVYSPGGVSGSTHFSLDASSWDNDVHNSMRFNDNYQDRFRTALTLKHDGKIDVHAGVSYLDEEFSFERPFTPTPSSFNLADSRYYYRVKGQESRIPLKDYAASANLGVPLGKYQNLVVAAHLRFGTIENEIHTCNSDTGEMRKSDLMEGKQITAEATLRDEIVFFDRLTLSLGLQYQWMRVYDSFYEDASILEEYDDRTDDRFNPKLGLVFRLSEATALRCSVARSSNSPSLMSMFGIFEQPPGRERIGNPLLETESAIGYEAGLEHRPSKRFMVGLTGFYNDLHDWMESTEARADLPDQDLKENAVLWQNVDRAMTAGVEIETNWMPTQGLKLFANYTYTHTRIDKFDENRIRYKYHTTTTTHNKEKEGNQLAGQPRHSANAGLVYAIPQWVDVSVTARYVGERYYDVENTVKLDAYTTVDLKLSRSFGRHVRASLSVNNLFDEEWQDDDRHASPGRMVFAGLKIGF